jgi:hypothetical protein
VNCTSGEGALSKAISSFSEEEEEEEEEEPLLAEEALDSSTSVAVTAKVARAPHLSAATSIGVWPRESVEARAEATAERVRTLRAARFSAAMRFFSALAAPASAD